MRITLWILVTVGILALGGVKSLASPAAETGGGQAAPGKNNRWPGATFQGSAGAEHRSPSQQERPVDVADQVPRLSPGVQSGPQSSPGAPADDAAHEQWRYRFQNGQWWYWLPEGRWAYWSNDRWLDDGLSTPGASAPQVQSTYRLDDPADDGYYPQYSLYGSPRSDYSPSYGLYDDSHGGDAFRGSESFGGFSHSGPG